jgi:hypothetical protein
MATGHYIQRKMGLGPELHRASTYLQPLEIFEASNNYIELLAVT